MCLSGNCRYLLVATCANKLLSYELHTTPIQKKELKSRTSNADVIDIIALEGNLFAVACADGSVATWDARAAREISREKVCRGRVTALALIGQDTLVVDTGTGHIMIYTMKQAFIATQLWSEWVHKGPVNALDTREVALISGGADKMVLMFQVTNGVPTQTAAWKHRSEVTDVALGKRWIVSTSFDCVRVLKFGKDHKPSLLREMRSYTGMHKNEWIHSVILMEKDDGKRNMMEATRDGETTDETQDAQEESKPRRKWWLFGKKQKVEKQGSTEFIITVGGNCGIVMLDLTSAQPLWFMNGRLKSDEYTGTSAIWDAALVPGGRLAICGPWDPHVLLVDVEDLLRRNSEPFWERHFRIIRTASMEIRSMIRSKTTEGFYHLWKGRNANPVEADADDSSSAHSWAQIAEGGDGEIVPEYSYGNPSSLVQTFVPEGYNLEDVDDELSVPKQRELSTSLV